jgi:predicted MFS family arabinose efflux permease
LTADKPGFFSALAFPSYRRLWFGAFTSSLGTWTQDVALAWLIHTSLGDPVYLGLRSFAAEAPLLAFMMVGGAMADRIDRRRILLTSQLLQMSFAALLAALYFSGRLGIAAILVVAFLTGLTQSQSAPTYQAVLSSLVPQRHIPNAVALNSLQFNLSRTLGPALAGVLLAQAGTGVCLLVNAASFLAVIAALWSIAIPSPSTARQESLRQSLAAGLRHVSASPVLRALMLLAFFGSFLAFPLITYLPVIADGVLHAGALGYSLLLAAFGAGAIVGALVTAYRGQAGGRGRTALFALMVHGVCVFFAVHAGLLAVALALLFAAGVSLSCGFSILNSLVQEHAPEQLRGRVVSIYGLAFRGGMPLGSLLAGFLVKNFGAPAVIGVFSLGVVLLAGGTFIRGDRVRAL